MIVQVIGDDVQAMTTSDLIGRWCAGAGNLYRSLSGGQKLFHLEVEAALKLRGIEPALRPDSKSPTGFVAYDKNENI